MLQSIPKVHHFEDENHAIKTLVALITDEAQTAIYDTGSFRIAIPGGKTPINLLKSLGEQTLDWESVKFYQTDERFVSNKNNNSNQKMQSEALETALESGSQFVTFDTNEPLGDKQKIANDYSMELDALDQPIFDIVLLGLGEDGHVASLFTTQDFEESSHLAIVTTNPSDEQRFSLSFNAIMDSKAIVIYTVGDKKSAILEEFLNGALTVEQMPVKKLKEHTNLHIFFAEEEVE
jgi:6-phosphogluconolactonase